MHSNIISTLKTEFAGCIRKSCETLECRLELSNIPETKAIFDLDCIATKQFIKGKRCDYVIAVMDTQATFVIPVEFKTNYVIVEKVKQQLEGGVRLIQKHSQGQFLCHPVLVSKSISKPALKELRLVKIEYNGRTARIRHNFCNQQLQWDKTKK